MAPCTGAFVSTAGIALSLSKGDTIYNPKGLPRKHQAEGGV